MEADEVHGALAGLSTINAEHDLPFARLGDFVKDAVRVGELITDSVPRPEALCRDPEEIEDDDGEDGEDGNSGHGRAQEPKDTLCDSETLKKYASRLQNNFGSKQPWGKPLKASSANDNPLDVRCYKMAAKDKFGAWFARHSVHANAGFDRWKTALESEFEHSLQYQSGPGAGSVRGIAADRKYDARNVENAGNMAVWHLSAAFPGPVAPREFTSLVVTSEIPYSGSGARQFVIYSRPAEHSSVTYRSGLVPGTYQSVEVVRELLPKSGNRSESNPVEWIMVTRSDPGGGIPKFMIERGTPGSIIGDVYKFLSWMLKRPESGNGADKNSHPSTTEVSSNAGAASGTATTAVGSSSDVERPTGLHSEKEAAQIASRERSQSSSTNTPKISKFRENLDESSNNGVLQNFANTFGSKVSDFIPQSLLPSYAARDDNSSSEEEAEVSDSSDDDELDKRASFHSAHDMPFTPNEKPSMNKHTNYSHPLSPSTALENSHAAKDTNEGPSNSIYDLSALRQHSKELEKLAERRRILDERILATRNSLNARQPAGSQDTPSAVNYVYGNEASRQLSQSASQLPTAPQSDLSGSGIRQSPGDQLAPSKGRSRSATLHTHSPSNPSEKDGSPKVPSDKSSATRDRTTSPSSSHKSNKFLSKGEKEAAKLRAKLLKEREKAETRYARDVAKVEEKLGKEVRKIEARSASKRAKMMGGEQAGNLEEVLRKDPESGVSHDASQPNLSSMAATNGTSDEELSRLLALSAKKDDTDSASMNIQDLKQQKELNNKMETSRYRDLAIVLASVIRERDAWKEKYAGIEDEVRKLREELAAKEGSEVRTEK